ncbi:MAG: serine/threonine-protein kinase [Myxococcota bacterium]
MPTTPLPALGERLAGRYEVRAKLAAGGMGAVFGAWDEATGGPVALKLLHPELTGDPEMQRRFKREGSILMALDHPAVVRVRDVGTDERGRAYLAMELLEGETLHARLERTGALPLERVTPIALGIAAGLEAAHAHGVLHGDLKPANVFLDDRAEGTAAVRLVDFGTSKVHGLDRLTRTGEVIGTPTYMAPELLTGEGGIDARIDVYGLGVLLYQALAGSTPFTERNPGRLLYQIALGQGVPLGERCPELPPEVVATIAQAMAPKAAERLPTAAAFAARWRAAVGA